MTTPSTCASSPGTERGGQPTIEARVCWLLEHDVETPRIVAISFTRAAAQDLEHRIVADSSAGCLCHAQRSDERALA